MDEKWSNLDQSVKIRDEGLRVVIEPTKPDLYDLDALLDRMRPDSFPDKIDFGKTRDREMW